MSEWFASIESLPPLWQWLSLLGTLTALLLAVLMLPTAFQMWWGRPRIDIEAHRHHGNEMVVLRLWITNDVVRNRVFKKLGVRRDPADISAKFRITEAATGRFVAERRMKLNVENGEISLRVTLPAGPPAIGAVAFQRPDEASAIVVNKDEHEPEIILAPGEYDAEISAYEHLDPTSRRFRLRVSEDLNATRWL